MNNVFNLMQGDCLELMKGVPDGSVDMILCDLPYGTTRILLFLWTNCGFNMNA